MQYLQLFSFRFLMLLRHALIYCIIIVLVILDVAYCKNYKGYEVPDEFIDVDKELVELIIESKSIETKEDKQNWFELLPLMTDDQVKKLKEILLMERKKLREIEERRMKDWYNVISAKKGKLCKYKEPIRCIKCNKNGDFLYIDKCEGDDKTYPFYILSLIHNKIEDETVERVLLDFAHIVCENIDSYTKIYSKSFGKDNEKTIKKFLSNMMNFALHVKDIRYLKYLIEHEIIEGKEKIIWEFIVSIEESDYKKAYNLLVNNDKDNVIKKRLNNWIGYLPYVLFIVQFSRDNCLWDEFNETFFQQFLNNIACNKDLTNRIQTDLLLFYFINNYFIRYFDKKNWEKINNFIKTIYKKENYLKCEDSYCKGWDDWYRQLTMRFLDAVYEPEKAESTIKRFREEMKNRNITFAQKLEYYTYDALFKIIESKKLLNSMNLYNYKQISSRNEKLIKDAEGCTTKANNFGIVYKSPGLGYLENDLLKFLSKELTFLKKQQEKILSSFIYKIVDYITLNLRTFIVIIACIIYLICFLLFYLNPIKYFYLLRIDIFKMLRFTFFRKLILRRLHRIVQEKCRIELSSGENVLCTEFKKKYVSFKFKNQEKFLDEIIKEYLLNSKAVYIYGSGGMSKTFTAQKVGCMFLQKGYIPVLIKGSLLDVRNVKQLIGASLPVDKCLKSALFKALDYFSFENYFIIIDDFADGADNLRALINTIAVLYGKAKLVITSRELTTLSFCEIVYIQEDEVDFELFIEHTSLKLVKNFINELKIKNFLYLHILNLMIEKREIDISSLAGQINILKFYIDKQIDKIMNKLCLNKEFRGHILCFLKRIATTNVAENGVIESELMKLTNSASLYHLYVKFKGSGIISLHEETPCFYHDLIKVYFEDLDIENCFNSNGE